MANAVYCGTPVTILGPGAEDGMVRVRYEQYGGLGPAEVDVERSELIEQGDFYPSVGARVLVPGFGAGTVIGEENEYGEVLVAIAGKERTPVRLMASDLRPVPRGRSDNPGPHQARKGGAPEPEDYDTDEELEAALDAWDAEQAPERGSR